MKTSDVIMNILSYGVLGGVLYLVFRESSNKRKMHTLLQTSHSGSTKTWVGFLESLDRKGIDYDYVGKDDDHPGCYMFKFTRKYDDGKEVLLSLNLSAAQDSEALSKLYLYVLEELF